MAWWSLWCLVSSLGAGLVSCISWSAMSVRYGYPATFDLGFAFFAGGAIGALLSLVTGFYLRRFSRVWWAQAAGFATAGVLGVPIAYFLHILFAIPVAIGGYLALLIIVPRRGRVAEYQCARCEYDLRGSMEAGRCPECGTRIDPSRIKKQTPSPGGNTATS